MPPLIDNELLVLIVVVITDEEGTVADEDDNKILELFVLLLLLVILLLLLLLIVVGACFPVVGPPWLLSFLCNLIRASSNPFTKICSSSVTWGKGRRKRSGLVSNRINRICGIQKRFNKDKRSSSLGFAHLTV